MDPNENEEELDLNQELEDAMESAFQEVAEPGEPEPDAGSVEGAHIGDEDAIDVMGDMTEEEIADAMGAGADDADAGADAGDAGQTSDDSGAADGADGADGADAKDTSKSELEEEREKNADLEARLRKLEGRYGDLKRDLQATLSQPAAAADEGGEPASTSSAGGAPVDMAAAVKAALEGSAAFKEMRDDFPEFGKAMEEVLSGIKIGGGGLSESEVEARAQKAANEAVATFIDTTVSAKHEGWVDTIRSERYGAWIEKQGEDTKSLERSPNPTDAIELLDQFKDFTDWVEEQDKETRDLDDAALVEKFVNREVESTSDAEEAAAAQQRRRRQRRLNAATQPTSGKQTSPRNQVVQSEEDAMEAGFKSVRGT